MNTFKIGDRVRIKEDSYSWISFNPSGQTGVISFIYSGDDSVGLGIEYDVKLGKDYYGFTGDELELVED